MQYIYGIHAVDSLLRNKPKSIQRLWVQQGRDDKRISSVVELAQNQGVPVAHESRKDLDGLVSGRHQGVVAETLDEPVHGGPDAANLWQESDLLRFVENATEPCLLLVLVQRFRNCFYRFVLTGKCHAERRNDANRSFVATAEHLFGSH